ncbi:putative ester cyclase [Sinorhizobium medicae]
MVGASPSQKNVFYEVTNGKIADVFSVIDKTAIEDQIGK